MKTVCYLSCPHTTILFIVLEAHASGIIIDFFESLQTCLACCV